MPELDRPSDLFDREEQWRDLSALTLSSTPGLRLAIVSGRRRHGKSYVLRRLAAATGGLYHQARELEKPQALAQFATDVADHLDLDPGSLSFPDWETALRTALGMPRRGRALGAAQLLVIDELPYLLGHSPELPSVLQLLYDEAQDTPDAPPRTVVVCGSALSVMVDLLSGTQPLRGRAQLDLAMPPFDFRQAREYWQIEDPLVAFHLDAILGGTPGYRSLVSGPPPDDPARFEDWVAAELLNPSRALFGERSYLLREDPRIVDKALYNSVLRAVAGGARSTSAIGTAVGRDANQLRHPLGVLESAGFLVKVEDVLTRRRPTYFLADPVVRFGEVVVEPQRTLLEERDAAGAWAAAAAAYSSQVLGPHFEHLARTWTAGYAGDRFGAPVGVVGPAVLTDDQRRSKHELDVVALDRRSARHSSSARIAVLGEAKSTHRRRSVSDVVRLEEIRATLVRRGHDAADAHLAVFSRTGFDPRLVELASTRPDVHLLDLPALYT